MSKIFHYYTQSQQSKRFSNNKKVSDNFQYCKAIANIFQREKVVKCMSQALIFEGYSVGLNLIHNTKITK